MSEIDTNALRAAAQHLLRVADLFDRVEGRAVDILQGEYILWPQTQFGVSDLSDLDGYEKPMPFGDGEGR